MPDVPARIMEISPESIRLRTQSVASCEACARGEGCGGGIFARILARKSGEIVLPARHAINFSTGDVGDSVRLHIATPELNRIALWTWGAPVVALLVAAAVYEWIGGGVGALFGAAVFLAGLLAPRYAARALVMSALELSKDDGASVTPCVVTLGSR